MILSRAATKISWPLSSCQMHTSRGATSLGHSKSMFFHGCCHGLCNPQEEIRDLSQAGQSTSRVNFWVGTKQSELTVLSSKHNRVSSFLAPSVPHMSILLWPTHLCWSRDYGPSWQWNLSKKYRTFKTKGQDKKHSIVTSWAAKLWSRDLFQGQAAIVVRSNFRFWRSVKISYMLIIIKIMLL